MSGGSWDYLYSWDSGKLLDNHEQLGLMAKRLTEHGEPDAARVVEEFYVTVKYAKIQIETRQKQLRSILHALEWYDSCDFGKDQLHEICQTTLRPIP